MFARWKAFAERFERETYALYLAYRDPSTPWYAKVFTALVVAYAVSPIDLIPDFIPVLGYLDDLILIPLGIWLCLKMIPVDVMAHARREAAVAAQEGNINSRAGSVVILSIWAMIAVILIVVAVQISKK